MMPMLVNTVSRLVAGALAHVEITTLPFDSLPSRPDCWRLIVNPAGKSIVMKNGLPFYFFKLKQHMRNYCAEKNLIVSETFIDEQIVGLLVGSKASGTGLPDIAIRVKSWIDQIDKTTQDDYRVVLPLSRYHFRGDVNTTRIKIVKITDKKIADNFIPVSNSLKDGFNAQELAGINETETFAIARTRANDKESAVELAKGMVDRFVYAVRLIDPDSTASSRTNSYKKFYMAYIVYNTSKGEMTSVLDRLNEPPNRIQTDDCYNKFHKSWMRLLDFLFDNHLTDLQRSIIDALYWYGEVDTHRDTLVSQYLYYLIGLEKLLVPGHERQKAKKFGRNAAAVLDGGADCAELYEAYYKKRNSLVHEGPVMVYKDDVDSIRLWLRSILLGLVDNTDKYMDLESYYKGVHGIEW